MIITPNKVLLTMVTRGIDHECPEPKITGKDINGMPTGTFTGVTFCVKAIELEAKLKIDTTPGRVDQGDKGDYLCYNTKGEFFFIMPGDHYARHLKPYRIKGSIFSFLKKS